MLRGLDDYRAVLRGMHGFHAPLEEALQAHPGLRAALPDLTARRKLPGLGADLRDLGAPVPARRAPIPDLATTARALGAAYVVEGATLGGAGISRHVRATLPDPAPQAVRFLAPYGGQTGTMWRRFQEALAAHDDDPDETVGAAQETFAALEDWLETEGVLR